MDKYEETLQKFNTSKEELKNNGVLESDLPFLFENKKNKIGFLLIHGSESSPCNTIEIGKKLSEKGYTTLGILLNGHGVSPEALNSGKVTWVDCYNNAVESISMLQNLVEKIYVLGISFGGGLSYLLGIEFEKSLTGVIAISAPSHSKSNPPPDNLCWKRQLYDATKTVEYHIQKLKIPTLILHGSDDNLIRIRHASFAYDNISTEQKKLIIYNKIGHCLGFGFNTDEVVRDIDNFVSSYKEQKNIKFELEYNHATSINLVGEFNNWDKNATPMYYEDGKWKVEIQLSEGNYHYKYLIDGHKWITDPNTDIINTPNGGKNSIICI